MEQGHIGQGREVEGAIDKQYKYRVNAALTVVRSEIAIAEQIRLAIAFIGQI